MSSWKNPLMRGPFLLHRLLFYLPRFQIAQYPQSPSCAFFNIPQEAWKAASVVYGRGSQGSMTDLAFKAQGRACSPGLRTPLCSAPATPHGPFTPKPQAPPCPQGPSPPPGPRPLPIPQGSFTPMPQGPSPSPPGPRALPSPCTPPHPQGPSLPLPLSPQQTHLGCL